MERKEKDRKERDRERERARDQLLVGVDRASSAPHRRITLERTHHLCSFVELSHFNPWAHFGNQLCTPFTLLLALPNTQQSSPPPLKPPQPQPLPLSANFHLCAVACGVRYTTLRHFHPKARTPPDNWPASRRSRTPGEEEGESAL